MYLPRLTTHLTVLYVGLDGSAGGIDTDGYDFAAVGAVHLDLGVQVSTSAGSSGASGSSASKTVNRLTHVASCSPRGRAPPLPIGRTMMVESIVAMRVRSAVPVVKTSA